MMCLLHQLTYIRAFWPNQGIWFGKRPNYFHFLFWPSLPTPFLALPSQLRISQRWRKTSMRKIKPSWLELIGYSVTALGTFANFYMVNDVRRCNSRRIVNTRFEIMRKKCWTKWEEVWNGSVSITFLYVCTVFFLNGMLFFIALTEADFWFVALEEWNHDWK